MCHGEKHEIRHVKKKKIRTKDALPAHLRESYDLLYENITRRLEIQLDSLTSIDTKASIFLATLGIILAGYLHLIMSTKIDYFLAPWTIVVVILLIFGAGYCSIRAFLLGACRSIVRTTG